MSSPRIASAYVNVHRPGSDVFPGPDAAELIAGKHYGHWVPNDHCFARDESGRWHAFGITHPWTDVANVHAGEYQSFHAIAPSGRLNPHLLRWNDTYYLTACGVHDVRVTTFRNFRAWTVHGLVLEMKNGVDPESPSIVHYSVTFYLFVRGWNRARDQKDTQGSESCGHKSTSVSQPAEVSAWGDECRCAGRPQRPRTGPTP